MRTVKHSKCQFPDCQSEIRTGGTMCTKHWRLYYAVKALKRNKGKTHTDLIKIAIERGKEHEIQNILLKQERLIKNAALERGSLYVFSG